MFGGETFKGGAEGSGGVEHDVVKHAQEGAVVLKDGVLVVHVDHGQIVRRAVVGGGVFQPGGWGFDAEEACVFHGGLDGGGGARVSALVVGLGDDEGDFAEGICQNAVEDDVVMEHLILQGQFFQVGGHIRGVLADHPFVVFAFVERLVAEGGAVSFGDFYPAIAGIKKDMVFAASFVIEAVELVTGGEFREKNSGVARPVDQERFVMPPGFCEPRLLISRR